MVQALNHIGLRVVLDVVYNHLHGSGPFDENSVLDKVLTCYKCPFSHYACWKSIVTCVSLCVCVCVCVLSYLFCCIFPEDMQSSVVTWNFVTDCSGLLFEKKHWWIYRAQYMCEQHCQRAFYGWTLNSWWYFALGCQLQGDCLDSL